MTDIASSSHPPGPSDRTPLELTAAQRAYLLLLASFAARGANAQHDPSGLREAWLLVPTHAQRLGVPQHELERSLLDAMLLVHVLAGIPVAIEAYATCHDTRPHDFAKPVVKPAADYLWPREVTRSNFSQPDFSRVPQPCPSCHDPHSTAIRRARATASLGAIYTSTVPNLEKFLHSLHPEFHSQVVIAHAYGWTFASERLRLFEKEAAAIGILGGLHTPRQLTSHLRGSIIVGLPIDFITTLLEEVFEAVWQDDGVYAETKEIWRQVQRAHRRKVAQQKGQPVDPARELAHTQDEEFQEQVRRANRMAQRGQQHPLYTAGRHVGGDEPDDLTPSELAQQLEPSSNNKSSADGRAPSLSDEEIESSLRTMMKQRARSAATDRDLRQANGGGSSPTAADDRWPFPPHILDPSGGLGTGGDLPGMVNSGSGFGVPMGGPPTAGGPRMPGPSGTHTAPGIADVLGVPMGGPPTGLMPHGAAGTGGMLRSHL